MSERRDDPGSGDLESIEGIGPAYRQRLEGAGVATVDALAAADAASLADTTGIAPGRLRKWIDVAAERTGEGERSDGPQRRAGGDVIDVDGDVVDASDVDGTDGAVDRGDGALPSDGDPADAASATEAGDAPLSDLAREVTERRRRREESTDDPFKEMAADAVDADDVWSEVFSEGDDGGADVGRVGVGAEAERASGAPEDRADHVVAKAEYCQRCPHLADPPDLQCTHQGTVIVEVVDSERFRVRGCPVVGDADGTIGRVDPTTDG